MPPPPETSNHGWLARVLHSRAVDALVNRLSSSPRVVAEGSQGSSTALLAASLALRTKRPVLLVVAHLDDADDALDDLELFAENPEGKALVAERFGALEVLPGETNVSLDLLAERLAIVTRLVQSSTSGASPATPVAGFSGPSILVAPIQALMQAVPEPGSLHKLSLTLSKGLDLSPAKLMDWLTTAGYNRVDAIEQPGEFATRGGIVDIYPPAGASGKLNAGGDAAPAAGAIRLDYFGDEIESIRRVDPDTMGSGAQIESIQIIGASSQQLQSDDATTSLFTLLSPDVLIVMAEVLELSEQARGYYERLTNPRGIYSPATVFQTITKRAHVEVNQYSSTAMQSEPIHVPVRPLVSFDHDAGKAVNELAELSKDNDVVVLCPKEAERERLLEILAEHVKELPKTLSIEVGYLHRGFAWDSGLSLTLPDAPAKPGNTARWNPHPGKNERRRARGEGREEKSEGREARGEERGSFPSPSGRGQGEGLASLASSAATTNEKKNQKTLTQPLPKKGEGPEKTLTLPSPGGRGEEKSLLLVPHQELFHRYHTRRRLRRIVTGAGTKTSDAFLEISVGDYVVHVDHGIALYRGMKAMKKEGRSEEYLTLEFADKALLHVPVTQVDLVQKYVGGFHGRPPLSLLGGKRWAKQKEAVAEAVKDMAAELLRVQAARASMPGIRYPTDTPWQKEFEAEFPYEETPDQLAAIAELKRDMADEQPMDRLICGDVGFGKTEVAIRAAFKAAEYGKQVAVLVPTTILAEQHERTFRGRMADYPFRVESLSRFKTDTQVRETLRGLKSGEVDIVVGTHRLLSQDIEFADLGLVIIDEEQRFGVEHKHKLMALRMMVDVLTLSATPIPRTLHMAMLGLRNISSLSTPPMDRRAIVTEVIPYDRERVKQAMIRELSREGQIYFVHNRVHDIQSVADDVQRLVPDARIAIGHGQMPGHELEEVMMRFVKREADILVSTTIIESGLDIPTANTMIIDRADQFGLADLHQLRGRVGRYKHRAYCYLLLPEDRPVTDVAAQRLRAIEQYAMLGAGFKIAMRDLEIRGAGNLLGAEQSGHIAAVGYEMYCHLLEQATHRLKHEDYVEPAKTHLELPIAGALPKAYIASDKFRMEAYRRLSRSSTLDDLEAVTRDFIDAYGQPPPPAQTMIDLAEIRVAAGTLGVEAIKLDGPDLIFRTRFPQKLDAVFKDAPGRASIIDEKTVYYRPPPAYLEPPTLLAVLRKLLVRPLKGGTEPAARA